MTFRRSSLFQACMAALASAPVALYAYLGQFSRIIADDYCYMAMGQSMAWGITRYEFNHWSGSYAALIFKDIMAPLDVLVPRVLPAVIIALWLVGSYWLVFQVLAHLKIDHSRRMPALALAAFIVTASIYALHSVQSFYFYSASARHTLPITLLTIYLALVCWIVGRADGRRFYWGIIAGGLLCFISAGGSEVFVSFQAAFLALCLLMSMAFLRNDVRRAGMLAFGVGWLTTLAGLAIQLSSPGVASRSARLYARFGLGPLDWDMTSLASKTLNWTVDYIGHPQIFLGFILLMAVGLLVMLTQYKPPAVLKTSRPVELAAPSLWLGLILQLLYALTLGVHLLFHGRNLGHFSREYMAIALLHIVLLLGFWILFRRRKQINAQLRKCDPGLLSVCSVIAFVFAFVLLFVLTYAKESLHPHPPDNPRPDYLLMSFLVFMGVMLWWLSAALSSAVARKYGLLVFCLHGMGLICMAAIVFAALFGRRHVDFRILSANAWLLTLPGLVWGLFFGWLLKHHPPASRFGQAWVKLFRAGGLAVMLTITAGIALGQAALIPTFQRYAGEWDARHQQIIIRRNSGQNIIRFAPLTWDLADHLGLIDFIGAGTEIGGTCDDRYFNVDALVAPDG